LAITALIGGAVLFKSGHFSAYANRGLGNLTGRTDIWAYAVSKIRERPLLGYGYQVSGAIFSSRFFPLWYGPWDQGPHSSLHDGYIGYAVGVGIPATLLWLYLTARSWVFVFRQTADPWNLKLVALVVVVPALIYNFTEASIIDFYGLLASLFGLSWALAERFRLRTLAAEKQASSAAFDALPAAAQALQGAAWSR
jgi:O-antigen ligase